MPGEEWSELKEGLDMYVQWKRAKAEARKARLEVEAWWQRAQQEIELARRRAEQGLELERLERLSKLSLEALVLAAKTPEQARIFEGLARQRIFQGLPVEKILALAAERDPRLAEALVPVLIKIHEAGREEEYRVLIERLMATQKEGGERASQDHLASLRAVAQMVERFADTTKEVARAATGGGAPIRHCPNGHPTTPSDNFCPKCGARLG